MLEPVVRAQRPQERLLPRVLRPPAEQPAQVRQHLVAVGDVELLERRDLLGRRHRPHHRLKRGRVPNREMRRRRSHRVGRIRSRAEAAGGRRDRACAETLDGAGWRRAPSSRDSSRCSPGAASSSRRSATTRSAAQPTRRLADLGVDLHVQTAAGSRRGERGRTSTRRASARSRCSARSCTRTGRCRSGATTRSSSLPATPLRCARRARAGFLAATPRESPTLREAGVPLDLLVGSLNDPGERIDGRIEAALVVQTDGAAGCDRRTASDSRPRRCPARSSTRTEPATRSRLRSASRSRAVTRCRRRSSSPHAPARP